MAVQHEVTPNQPTPPFNAPAARRLREALGMAPGHVAYGMRASYGLAHITPDVIVAWERGDAAPTSGELTALAGALWCSVSELIGTPRTLREYRLALGLAPEDVARAVGMEIHSYLRTEETGEWQGNDRQAAALAETLRLSPRALSTVTGRDAHLAELLRDAARTRWQGSVRPIARLVPVPRRELEDVLHEMHLEYQALMAATLSWGGGTSPGAGDAGREFLERILDEFWSRIRHP